MEVRHGTPVSPGVVIGRAFILESEGMPIPRQFIMPDEVQGEIERLYQAREEAKREVEELQKRLTEVEEDESSLSEIFKAHLKLLEDSGWVGRVAGLIENKHFTAEFALSDILRRYVNTLERLDNTYMAERAADIFDIERRIMNKLVGGRREEITEFAGPVIIVAESLSPSQTVSLCRENTLGFITDAGGRTSHTAILARALGIPAVVGLNDATRLIGNNETIIVDGTRGVVVVNPDQETLERYRQRERDIHDLEARVTEEVRGLPAVTKDGREIALLGNIEFPSEVQPSLEYGASGIGLYRTEFLYHSIASPPDEEAHFNAYVEAMDHLGDRPITIRLLDMGADKFLEARRESNPFLGLRSIRLLLEQEPLLRTQLRAILRASPYGNPRIMIPLVSQLSEVTRTREIMEEVKQELSSAGVEFKPDIPLGVMIEVPCAALMADSLAKHCDFFSIGTNDLIQYTLAVDRNNAAVADIYSPADPAVLRLMRMTVEAADRNDIPVSVCGEMAGELLYTVLLVGLGLRQLSMGAKIIPELKKVIRSITYQEAKEVADRACGNESREQNMRLLEEKVKDIFPEVL